MSETPSKDKPSVTGTPGAKPAPDVAEEEVAHLDDAIIGRAFRWSAIALVVIVVLIAGVVVWLKYKPQPAPDNKTQLSAPVAGSPLVAEIPKVEFTDVTAESGITFLHNNGAYGEKLLPETMGGGVAFLDFDNDGDQDLLFVNSTYWPGKIPSGKSPATSALYANDGKGHFTDVTTGSGLDVSLYGMGAAVGDYDNDGLPDVFLSAVGANKLFHNEGNGKFREVTTAAGVGGAADAWSTACTWLDYDNDGDLDLFVANYVRWSRDIDFEVGYKIDGVTRAYGQPMNFQGAFPYLYRNDGGGHFAEVSAESGLHVKNSSTGVPAAKSLGVAAVDLNGDGWLDLVIANDTVPNNVFTNHHNGTFKEVGALSGIAFDSYGHARGAMGIDAARYRNDGALGIAIGNFANEMTALYVNQGESLVFADEAISEGVGPASRLLLKFGVFFFDYDLDGRLDLLTANGHLEEEISKIQASQQYRQPAQLFWNSGASSGATFVPVPPEKAGKDLFKPIVGRGSAYGDIDGDGDLDVVMTQVGGTPLLLRNDQQLGHHFLRLKLVGKQCARDAVGAWLKVHLKSGEILWRQVTPNRSYLSQSELPVTVGLGKAGQLESIKILWPGGKKQVIQEAKLDGLTVVEQPL